MNTHERLCLVIAEAENEWAHAPETADGYGRLDAIVDALGIEEYINTTPNQVWAHPHFRIRALSAPSPETPT